MRSVSKSSSAYAAEYADLSILKRIADEFNITILLLHHNRKMGDDSDPFNMISGTMAIMGAADTTLILYREKRSDEETTLSITGRDVEMNSYKITWDKETCKQRLIGETEVLQEFSEQKEYENDPVVITIKSLLKESPCGVSKTASDLLIDIIKYAGRPDGHTPTSLGRKIKSLTYKLYQYDRIVYKYARRMHTFEVEKTKVYQFPADHSEQTAIDDGGEEDD